MTGRISLCPGQGRMGLRRHGPIATTSTQPIPRTLPGRGRLALPPVPPQCSEEQNRTASARTLAFVEQCAPTLIFPKVIFEFERSRLLKPPRNYVVQPYFLRPMSCPGSTRVSTCLVPGRLPFNIPHSCSHSRLEPLPRSNCPGIVPGVPQPGLKPCIALLHAALNALGKWPNSCL